MVGCLVAGGERVIDVTDELLFVTAPAIAFNNVGFNRFNRAPDLAAFFEHLELGQFGQSRLMNYNNQFSRQFPNIEIAVIHPVSSIKQLVSATIENRVPSVSASRCVRNDPARDRRARSSLSPRA